MNWLTRLLISNWRLVLMPIVLLGVWLSGVWVGEGRTQRAWDAERHQVALAQADRLRPRRARPQQLIFTLRLRR